MDVDAILDAGHAASTTTEDETEVPPTDGDSTGTPTDQGIPREDPTDSEAEPSNDENEYDLLTGGEDELPVRRSATGRVLRNPSWMNDYEMAATNASKYEIRLTTAEKEYYTEMKALGEFGFVGAGVGGGFTNTSELKPMKYKQAMATADREEWQKAVDEEHKKMASNNVFKVTEKKDLPDGAKVLSSTWAMKKKASGTYRARLNARGYEQLDGMHYDSTNTAAPVVHDITIRIILTMMVMANWIAYLQDVKGAFLKGEFNDGEVLFMEVPEGFEKYYPSNVVNNIAPFYKSNLIIINDIWENSFQTICLDLYNNFVI